MNPGMLKHRITIQRYIEHEDLHGITQNEWVDLKTVWGAMNNLFGKEYWEAKKYKEENTVEIVIRYGACKDLTVKDRIKAYGIVYNIKSIDNVCYRNEVLKIKAQAVG